MILSRSDAGSNASDSAKEPSPEVRNPDVDGLPVRTGMLYRLSGFAVSVLGG